MMSFSITLVQKSGNRQNRKVSTHKIKWSISGSCDLGDTARAKGGAVDSLSKNKEWIELVW